jgi:hypothetical protein
LLQAASVALLLLFIATKGEEEANIMVLLTYRGFVAYKVTGDARLLLVKREYGETEGVIADMVVETEG